MDHPCARITGDVLPVAINHYRLPTNCCGDRQLTLDTHLGIAITFRPLLLKTFLDDMGHHRRPWLYWGWVHRSHEGYFWPHKTRRRQS